MTIKNLLGALYTGNKEKAQETFNALMTQKSEQALQVKKVAVAADIYNEGTIDENIIGDTRKKMAAKSLKKLQAEEEKLRAAFKELEKPMFRVNDNLKRAGKKPLSYSDISDKKEKVKAKIQQVKQAKQKLKDKFPNLRVSKD